MRIFTDERGFWSAYVLIFIVTLALMGMGAAMLMRSEGVSVSKTAERIQADYTAESGVFFGVKAMEKGILTTDDNQLSFYFGNSSVYLSLEQNDGQQQLTVNSSYGNSSSTVVVDVSSGSIADRVITAAGDISGITAKNESGVTDATLLLPNAEIPTIDVATLYALSLNATPTNDKSGATFSPINGYMGSFFKTGTSVPNVTRVYGNLTVGNNITVYGIFVVDGSVTLNSGSNVQGVIYVVNSSSTTMNRVFFGATVRVNGGVVSNGSVNGFGFGNVTVQHNLTFMQAFASFQIGVAGNQVEFSNWQYQ